MTHPPTDADDRKEAGRWNLRVMTGRATLLLLFAASAFPAYRAHLRTQGYDSKAYIGAAYRLDDGKSPYTPGGFELVIRDSAGGTAERLYFPPFLYHPLVAVGCHAVMRVTGFNWMRALELTNFACWFVLSCGLVALCVAAGAGPVAAGLLLLGVWLLPGIRFPLLFGNLGPVMAGLVLAGSAALLRGRPLVAASFLAAASLFKPPVTLILLVLALFWRPGESRRGERVRLLVAWPVIYLLLTLAAVPFGGAGGFLRYLGMLRTMGGQAWCISWADASAGSLALRWASPWTPDYHAMVVWGKATVEASTGRWAHPGLQAMNSVNLAAILLFFVALRSRRAELRRRPLTLLALAVVVGFIAQPVNWPHNYGMLLCAPVALWTEGRGARDGWRARLRLACSVLFPTLLLIPLMPFLQARGFFRENPILPEEPTPALLSEWNIVRALDSIPALCLIALAVVLLPAARAEEGDVRDED